MGMVTGTGTTAIHQLFSYDSSGNVVSVDYSSNGGSTFTTYYYLRNAQNDIVKIIDGNGNAVVEYTYDSWGKPIGVTGTLASTLGANQPFRYRGYVYDTETGWYYLQSRYYDPSIGRFISADVLLSTTQGVIGNNSFAYCGNDPINRLDDEGAFWETVFDVISLIASVAEVVANPADPWAWAGLVGDAIDLIPFVSGVGEVTRAVKLVDKAVDVADNLHDAGKAADMAKIATTGSPNTIGKLGEQLAGINPNAKVSININGRVRIPDKMTPQVLTEVKNVKYISNTSQLRDFADYAKLTNRSLELYVRPTTVIAKTVIDAGWEIKYLW